MNLVGTGTSVKSPAKINQPFSTQAFYMVYDRHCLYTGRNTNQTVIELVSCHTQHLRLGQSNEGDDWMIEKLHFTNQHVGRFSSLGNLLQEVLVELQKELRVMFCAGFCRTTERREVVTTIYRVLLLKSLIYTT